MPLLRRKPRLPPAVSSRLSGVTSIAWAPAATGGWVVLSASEWITVDLGAPEDGAAEPEPERADRTGADGIVRRGWHEVDNARWVAESRTVVLRWIDGTTQEVALGGDDERVPQVVRERVEASLVHRIVRDLPGGVQVRAAIRRDGAGELSSQVSVVGTAHVDAVVAEVATQLEAEARAAVGLAE